MKASDKAKEAAYNKALKNLFSSDDAVVMEALKSLSEIGDHRVIHPLLELMLHGSDKVNAGVEDVLFQLKDSQAMKELMEALDNPKYEPIRATILAAFWNTGQWPVEHLVKLCEIAVNGTYQEAFEVLTIIEHMEGSMEPAELEQALEPIREYLMQQEGHENYVIIETIHSALNQFGDV